MSIYSRFQRPAHVHALSLAWMLFVVVLYFTYPQQIVPIPKQVIQHEIGCSYVVPEIKPEVLIRLFTKFKSDSLTSPQLSQLVLLEDGKPIGYPHAPHNIIRTEGGGNYSHWGETLYFSTLDCSDPRSGDKQYEVLIPVSLSVWVIILWFAAAYILIVPIASTILNNLKVVEGVLSTSRTNYYFFASFATIVAVMLIKYPSLVISAEFYAETATLFFKYARESSFFEILTYTDADYLVTFQLLISFILIRLFGVVEYFPHVINFLFLLFVAFSVSLINLRAFRTIIASDFLRFMIGLSISMTPNFELYHLLHANIFGFMIFLLFIFVDKKQFNRWLFYFLTFLLFMTGIARPNLAAFLPVYIILFGIAVKKKEIRDIVFYGTGTVSLGLQAYVMIMSQLYWSHRLDTGIYNEISGVESLFLPLIATINQYFETLLGVLFKEVDGTGLIISSLLITAAVIFLACYYLYCKKRFLILYYFGLSQILVFGLLYFITFSSPIPIGWDNMSLNTSRWWVYSNYVMYLSLMVLAYNTIAHISSKVAVVALSVFAIYFSIYDFYHYTDPYSGHDSLSNWEKYRHLLKEDNYYIPVNPVADLQWGIAKDNGRIALDIREKNDISGIQLSDTKGNLELRSILIVNQEYYKSMRDLIIKAYDKEGKEIAIPHRLNDFEDKYLYYYFTERVRPYRLLFFNEKLQKSYIRPELHFYGKLGTDENIVITKY